MDLGEQSAIITSTTLMLALYATVLDMGWYYSLLENYHSSEPKLCMDRWITFSLLRLRHLLLLVGYRLLCVITL